jgi:hypothetical protein
LEIFVPVTTAWQRCDLVGHGDVDDRGAGGLDLLAQRLLAPSVPVDVLVLGERGDQRRDLLAEGVADVGQRARRVLDDVVQQPGKLRGLVGARGPEDVGDRLGVREPLAGTPARADVGVEQEADGAGPGGRAVGDGSRHGRPGS